MFQSWLEANGPVRQTLEARAHPAGGQGDKGAGPTRLPRLKNAL
jgi:hypothetical protein